MKGIKLSFVLKLLLISLISIKALALAVGSYPFDFATYVYQARSYFEYGISPLFYWNKGIVLLGIFYGQYSVYQSIIQLFYSGIEQTGLLHFIYKVPFLFADIGIGYLIYQIVIKYTQQKKWAVAALFAWLSNPLVLWLAEFQGQYAILAAFFSILSIKLLQERRFGWSSVALALSFSIYYYAAVFIPFILLYVWKNAGKGIRGTLSFLIIFIASTTATFAPFLLSQKYLSELLGSLLHHSAPDANAGLLGTQLPTFSLFKVPYYAIFHEFPTSITADWLFSIAQLSTYLGMVLILVVAGSRLRSAYKLKKYEFASLSSDLVVALSIFLIMVGKFQDHYLIWIFPLYIVLACIIKSPVLIQIMAVMTFVTLLLILSGSDVGIYLLDILPFGSVSHFMFQSELTRAIGGFALLLLVGLGGMLAYKWQSSTKSLIPNTAVYWGYAVAQLFIANIIIAGLIGYFTLGGGRNLGSDMGVYSFKYQTSDRLELATEKTQEKLYKDDFSTYELAKVLLFNSFIDNREEHKWYLYNIGASSTARSAIVREADGRKALILEGLGDTELQLNMGANSSSRLIPLNRATRYNARVSLNRSGIKDEQLSVNLRFIDYDRNVISGSDTPLLRTSDENGQEIYEYTFNSSKDYAYVEYVITVKISSTESQIVAPYRLALREALLSKERLIKAVELQNLSTDKQSAVTDNVLRNRTAIKAFEYKVVIPRTDSIQRIEDITLGNCAVPTEFHVTPDNVIAFFQPECAMGNIPKLSYKQVNYDFDPSAEVFLAHKQNGKYTSAAHKYQVYILGMIFLVINFGAAIIISGRVWNMWRLLRK